MCLHVPITNSVNFEIQLQVWDVFKLSRGKFFLVCHKANQKKMKSIILRFKTSFKKGICFLILAYCSQSFNAFSQENDKGINIGFIYPISTHGTNAKACTNVFSLNAIAGVSREEKNFSLSGISNIIRENAHGFQAAGFSNHIGGFADGFQVAGFMNKYESAKGFQLAGFTNIAKSNVTGFQLAGFLNTAHDRNGLQIAGFTNIANDVSGQQLAGFINVAENVKGNQIAGFINIAKKVKGVQLAGFINIADSSDYPIGIINLVKSGEQSIGLSTDDNLTTLLSFRSGGSKLYGIIGLGSNLKNSKDIYSVQFGLGAHLITANSFRLNTELTTIMLQNFKRGEFTKYSLSVMPAVKFSRRLELFAGPSINYINTNTTEGKELIDRFVWSNTNRNNHLNGLYIGYAAGIHLML